jgi:aryl-alcohol dehydrogenase-like predicted oxidoreductase
LNYRRLGRYGLKISEVSLGGWLTHGRSIDDATTEAIVHRAFHLGVNFFDTADVYHRGAAEESLGRAIRSLRREALVLGTKCYFPMSESPNDRGLSRKHVFESVHQSLKRLGTDYIDLMQFHRFDVEVPLDETIRAIDDLVRQGKVLYWGISEWKAHQIADAVHTARGLGCSPPSSNQPVYNMLVPGIEESVIPACRDHGLGLVVFSPLAQGVLTGKYRPGQPPPPGSRATDPVALEFMGQYIDDAKLKRVELLADLATRHGYTLAQFSLAWCLRKSEITSVIVGATSVEQLEANVAASGVVLPEEIWEQAMEVLRAE